jgi:hypothetical protein
MAKSNQINAYPKPNLQKQVKEIANKQGVSVSHVVCDALDYYLKNVIKKPSK